MATFKGADIEKYGSQGGGTGFFSLKNDKETAEVRFLYNSAEDVEGYTVHEVEVDGKRRYVNCLRTNYNSPIDECPFCKARKHQIAKLFVPMFNETEGQVQVWERGKKFYSQLSSMLSRYDREPIVAQVFEIERNGKPRDTQTNYGIYRLDRDYPTDDTTLEDFEIPNIVGSFVLDKSADDMEYYLENGCFPSDAEPPRRRGGDEPRRRRTPREEDENF